MKKLSALFISGVVLVMGAMTVGCGDDAVDTNPTTDGGGDVIVPGDGGPPGDSGNTDANDGGPQEFTEFVKQLILTQTTDKTLPTTTEDKKFVDSHDPKAFPPAFFP